MTTTFRTRSADQTRSLGCSLAAVLAPGAVVLLRGPLGSGKTTLVQGVAQGCGISEPVLSPTFALAHEYRGGRVPLFHLDLYRLGGPDEVWDAGLAEYLDAPGITIVEWPERLGDALPAERIEVSLAIGGEDERELEVAAHGPAAAEAVARLEVAEC